MHLECLQQVLFDAQLHPTGVVLQTMTNRTLTLTATPTISTRQGLQSHHQGSKVRLNCPFPLNLQHQPPQQMRQQLWSLL